MLWFEFYKFIVYLKMLVTAQTTQHKIIEELVNN
jgi:hypothetical protein